MTTSLPNDVLLLIGEHLDRQDRWNLLFVSNHFHDLFLPLFYRSVALHNWHSTLSFLHAILKRPSLARAVRQLDLNAWQSRSVSDDERAQILDSVQLTDWLTAISHSEDDRLQWKKDLQSGFGDPWIALVLPLLGQLERLRLAYASNNPYLDRLMQRAVNPETPFDGHQILGRLREVSLRHREDLDRPKHQDGADLEDRSSPSSSSLILPFFQLPSVQTLRAESVIDPSSDTSGISEDEGNVQGQWPTGFSSIKEIDLRSSNGNHGMESLITSCADLRSFKYQHSDAHILSHGYQPSAFHRSLIRSKHSLQTLWLDQHGDHYPFTGAGLNQTHDEWFGSLAGFVALRDVRIRLPNLLDIRYQNQPSTPLVDILPPKLETLYIEGCEERNLSMLASQLQTVIKNRQAKVPQLHRVDIEGAFHNDPSDDSGHTESFLAESPENTIKDKILQAAEPLHMDCLNAGMELHLHDRICSASPGVSW
ncbi:hypothetical protein N7474_002303 [Penicillium riverlandense]|uniref:uncharacterized protein n=1 Tax=Penicillium riverlandense TaxID=1903569 RepID=UPI002547187D|nr:uncharacterized protein N7474_002303 [Penicillium riverlandense]KAJ5825165.1 hypothetical protein N7474_002303 [Penicillium riverlandense]